MSASPNASRSYPDRTIAGLILAAGSSRRLGRPKQTLPFGDGTLLEHAVAQAEAVPGLHPLVVVLPPGHPFPAPQVRRAQLTHVDSEGACSSSLHAGLRALPETIHAVAILPGDQPALDSDLIDVAVRAWLRTRPVALTLSYRGRPGHPLIFSATLLDDLRALHGDKAMWRLLEHLGDAVERVPIKVPLPPDIDTEEDYERAMSNLAASETASYNQ